jgi:FlaA1/EpsC-like NDP-sugar epimerase
MTWLRNWSSAFLVIPDALILYAGLLVGHHMSVGSWLLPHTTEWDRAVAIALGVYGGALYLSGVYATRPSRMQLSDFIDLGSYLVGAWGVSVTAIYLVGPSTLPPRGMMIVHGLVVLVGVLGYRALLHRVRSGPADPVGPQPHSPPDVTLSDLVPRDPVTVDRAALRNLLSNRTVLVTGAGGSIGAELSRQLLALNPFRLVLVDVSEHNLHRLETSLRSRSYDGDLEFCIADVRDETVMNGLMTREQPDVVLHTAAYKHLPLMERHPAEAFRNNTLATVHLVRLCERNDVEQFVFVSTDKAVHPSSVLGATKQRAEWYVRTTPSSLQSTTVRFGNVFGSQGSVVPRFEEKLAAGEPLPVTHPDMERYFMTPDEACRLLLQTLLLAGYPTYILEMGTPMRIQWLAEQLIEHWYPDVDPASLIEHVGHRPGEKMSEQLVQAGESVHSTTHPDILGLESPVPYRREELEAHFQHLQALCNPSRGSREQLRNLLLNDRPVRPESIS